MIARRRFILLAALAAGSLAAAAAAGAATTGTATAQSGFSVENLLMELSVFLPEEYAGFFGDRGILVGRPGGAAAGGEAPGNQPQGSQQGTQPQGGTSGQPGTQGGQRPQGFDLPQFKRDAKLMFTARQVDALLPVLQDLQKTPYPTPSQAKKVTTTVDATLTKQQKDAYDKYVKEREKAMEEMRKQFASRSGSTGTQGAPGSGTGGFVTRNNDGTGQAGQGQRQQVDPAELRRQMLEGFIETLLNYRKGLK